MLESKDITYSLLGRFTNTGSNDTINSADSSLLCHVDKLKTSHRGVWRWEHEVLGTIWRRKYDAFVLEGRSYTLSTWLALIVGRLRKVPVFLWGHGWKRAESGLKLVLRKVFYSMSSGLLLYGNFAREYAEQAGIPDHKLAVVNNSIYSRQELLSCAQEKLCGSGKFNIIVSARLTRRHKLHLLADAIARIPDGPHNIQVVVIGDGSEREFLENYYIAKGINVQFLGAIYGADLLAPHYAHADVAVSPRASGLNIVQALGFSTPVIAPYDDPTSGPESELVTEGKTGALFKLDDIDDFARVISELHNAPLKVLKMGKAGREQILRTHTAEAHATAIENAILDFLSQ